MNDELTQPFQNAFDRRVGDEQTIAAVDAWFDWRTENGLEDPPPAEFLGGVNDLPAGAHGFFTVELVPGD